MTVRLFYDAIGQTASQEKFEHVERVRVMRVSKRRSAGVGLKRVIGTNPADLNASAFCHARMSWNFTNRLSMRTLAISSCGGFRTVILGQGWYDRACKRVFRKARSLLDRKGQANIERSPGEQARVTDIERRSNERPDTEAMPWRNKKPTRSWNKR